MTRHTKRPALLADEFHAAKSKPQSDIARRVVLKAPQVEAITKGAAEVGAHTASVRRHDHTMPTDDDNSAALDAECKAIIAEYRRRNIQNDAVDALIGEAAALQATLVRKRTLQAALRADIAAMKRGDEFTVH